MLNKPFYIDETKKLFVPGDKTKTLQACVDHFIESAKNAIRNKGAFYVALSGGSTPKAIFDKLPSYLSSLDWSKVYLFWSDERSVPPTSQDSNYHMAMTSGFGKLPILKDHIFRMRAEDNTEEHAANYEKQIEDVLGGAPFDLILLGMGEDGHTASLFPKTEALKVTDRLVVANHVPQKDTWRMTMTFPCLNQAKQTVFYVLGENKKDMLYQVFFEKNKDFPCQRVGTKSSKAIWIADQAAASRFPKP